MSHTCRTYAALVLVAAAIAAIALVLMPAPASAMTGGTPAGRYTSTCADLGGAVSPDRAFAAHVVGCGTDVDGATVAHLALLRDAVCEGLSAHVPAARMVDRLAGELGDRTDAVTLFTDASVWCASR